MTSNAVETRCEFVPSDSADARAQTLRFHAQCKSCNLRYQAETRQAKKAARRSHFPLPQTRRLRSIEETLREHKHLFSEARVPPGKTTGLASSVAVVTPASSA